MKLGYALTIEQTQKLAMTPELIQAIQILQFNHQELAEFVQNELLENPVLEAEKDFDVQEIDIRARIREADYEEKSFRQWEYAPDEDDEYPYEQYASEEDTLTDYLLGQLQFSSLKGCQAKIARYIIEAVDENGYLTMSVEEIAAALHAEPALVEETLSVVQTFDPLGVAARSLQECLTIQLAAKGLLTDEIEYVIEHMLEDLAENRVTHIARTLGIRNQEVQQIMDLIRSLEPKPGRVFSGGETTRYVIPDILVEKVHDEYVVSTNDTSIPKLMVSSYYHKLAAEAAEDAELNRYLNERFNAAVWLIKSIEQRKQTIYNVACAIVRYQKDFFDHGSKYLKPLTLKQIADEVQVHESTVSRSINGKYMQSPRGVFELKYFFSSGVSGEDGVGVSSNSIKTFIREMIAGEDPHRPYSDQDMVELLREKGIEISRRTVAKYREGMQIQSSSKRKRF